MVADMANLTKQPRGGISEDGQKRLDDWTGKNVAPPADLTLADVDALIAHNRQELARVAREPNYHSPVFVSNTANAIVSLEKVRMLLVAANFNAERPEPTPPAVRVAA